MIAMAPQPAARPSAQTPSSQRPIPLQGRLDLTAERMEFQGTAWWVLKDPVRLTYHRLQGEHYRVLGLLDGKRSLKEIRDELSREFPALPLQLSDVQRMITGLHANGLVWSDRPGQAGLLIARDRQTRRKKFKQFFTNILSCRMPGWDPDTFLELIHPWLRWLYHPVTGAAALLLVLASTLLLAVQFAEFRSRLPEFQQFFSWKNLAWLWVTVGATKVLHEFGHGLTCKHYGSECHEMGVMLLVFSPTLYCDVTDSWMLHNKWQRIWIAAAGMVVEVVLSAVAIITWWFTTPGLLNHLCLNVFFVTTITTVIFNANPLLRYDGYYMLSDWLGIPNLRTKSNKLLRDAFAETCLGLPSQPDPLMPDRGHGWFITYAIATAVYGWIVLSAILLFLYVVLKPYGLQSIGITMAAFSLAGVVGNLAYNIWQIISAPRSESMSTVRTSITAAVVTAALAAALAVPLPWYIEAPFLIEPHEVEHVFTPVAGQLAEFPVRPGMQVEQGQLLAMLRDIEKEDQYRKLQTSREVQIAEAATLHALEKVSEHALALKRLDGIETQMREYEAQLAELTIRAPIAGHVVAPPRVPAPKLSTTPHLSEWFGEPSQPQNLGCVLQPRTHLLSLAPDGRVQALIYLDQAHRDDLALDGQVEIRFDHLANRTYKARVVEIARQQSEMAPTALSNKVGGGLDSITDSEGHERLTSVAYQARVVLDEETELLKPGMRGNARFLVERRSAALWLWRLFRRTLHFRI